MKYTARKPFRYGTGVYMTGQQVTVEGDDVRMLQAQGKIGGPVIEKPVIETATVKPVENAMQPPAEYKTFEPEIETVSLYENNTVVELREMLKEKNLPTYGTKAELIERLEGE